MIFVVLAAILFSLKGIFAKILYASGMSITLLLVWRLWLALVIFAIPMFYNKHFYRLSFHKIKLSLLVGVFFYISTITDFNALYYIPANIERMILFTYPMFILIISAIFIKRPISNRQWAVLGAAQIGLILLLNPLQGALLYDIVGVLSALAAAITYGSGWLIGQKSMENITPNEHNFWFNAVSSMLILGQFVATGGDMPQLLSPTPEQFVYLALMAVFCTVIPFYFLSIGIKKIGSEQAGIVSMAGPVSTLVLTYYLLGETLEMVQIIGAGIILLSIASLSIKGKRVKIS